MLHSSYKILKQPFLLQTFENFGILVERNESEEKPFQTPTLERSFSL